MSDARVGARQSQNRNLVENNTTYEEVDVFCEGEYIKKKRPVKSDVWIKLENLGQGTKTNEKVRVNAKEENKKSQTVNQSGHFVPNAGGGSGTNQDNIFIQDKRRNQSDNKKFDNQWIKLLKVLNAENDNYRVNLVHELEYLKNNSGCKPDFVTITAKFYSDKNPDICVEKISTHFKNFSEKSMLKKQKEKLA